MTTPQEVMDNLDYDSSVVGVEVDVGTHHITSEEIIAYAKSIGETNPLYLDEEVARASTHGALIAPPLFYNLFINRLEPGLDPQVKFGTSGFDAGQHAEFFGPMRAGDTISAKAQIASVYAKTGRTGTMVFTVRRVTFTNQNGEKTATLDRLNVRRDIKP